MSSSKIIKSAGETQEITDFSFHAIVKGAAAPSPRQPAGGGFIPLGIFDLSEVGPRCGLAPRVEPQVAPEEPPGRFISDEEFQHAQDEAYQRGLQDGKNLAERGLQHVFRSLRIAVEDLQELRGKVLRDSEDHLLALTMTIAGKVVQREVQQDREAVVRLIRAAVGTLNRQDELIIRVNPDDHILLTGSYAGLLQRELGTTPFQLKADPAVDSGGCLVETRLGTVDAGLEAQLEEFYRSLLEEQARQSHETNEA